MYDIGATRGVAASSCPAHLEEHGTLGRRVLLHQQLKHARWERDLVPCRPQTAQPWSASCKRPQRTCKAVHGRTPMCYSAC
jgi:hypothetical protein